MDNTQLVQISDDITFCLSNMNNQKDVFNFLRDILSEKEIVECARRFEVAKLLDQKVPYAQIEQKTNMSSTTIARISKYLSGENAWYKNAISMLKSITKRHHEAH